MCSHSCLVSVCVATYNHEQFIEECLRSIATQRVGFEFEIIVADDGSTDNTPAIVRKLADEFHDLIIPVLRRKNIGPYANYADLHRRATGKFVAHVDGDDYWYPGKLEAQVKFLRENGDTAAVYTNAALVSESGCWRGRFNNNIPEKFDLKFLVEKENFLCHSSMLYRNIDEPLFPDDRDNFVDYATHIRLARRGVLGYINEDLTAYRVNVRGSMVMTGVNDVRRHIWNAVEKIPGNEVSQWIFMCAAANFAAPMIRDDIKNRSFVVLRWYGSIKVLDPLPKFMLPVLISVVFVFRLFVSLCRKTFFTKNRCVYRVR